MPERIVRRVDAEAVARVLAGVPVFSALSNAERSELIAHLRARRFSRDEVVFHRDDAGGHLYVILSGSVKVAIPDEEGHEVVVAVERDGAVFGELALFDDAPRSATVTALDETQVVTLAREDGAARVGTDRGPGVPRRPRAGGEMPARPRDGARTHGHRAHPGRPRCVRGDHPGIGEPGPRGSRVTGRDRGRSTSRRGQGTCAPAQTGPLLGPS